jgi:hypothetical protein
VSGKKWHSKICNRCGICCVIPGINRPCKHLIRLESGKTICRVYRTRLGRKIGEQMINGVVCDVLCVLRGDTPQTYPNCPFNEVEHR